MGARKDRKNISVYNLNLTQVCNMKYATKKYINLGAKEEIIAKSWHSCERYAIYIAASHMHCILYIEYGLHWSLGIAWYTNDM